MQFELITPTEENLKGNDIVFNYDELKNEIQIKLEKYKNLVYTDDSIKEAKNDRATLNKFKTTLDNKRLEIKKAYMTPYNDFENKVKDLIKLVDEPVLAIDTQIKGFEEKQKQEKQEKIKAVYNEKIGTLSELVSFDILFNPQWLNSGFKLNKANEELCAKIEKINQDLKIIADFNSEFQYQLTDYYLKWFDMSDTLQEKARLEARKKLVEEQIKRATPKVYKETQKSVNQISEEIENNLNERLYTRKFQVRGTAAQLAELGAYMKNNGIEYGAI